MCTDIEGFSRIGEAIEQDLLASRVSRYLEALNAAISDNRGMIDKSTGNSIKARWNAPQLDPDHIADACKAALQAAAVGRELAEKWYGRPSLRTRIGVHTGMVVAGKVGVRDQIDDTLVEAVANRASRLQGLNKVYGTDILASDEVAQETEQHFIWRPVDRVVPAGTAEALEIYQPLGLRLDGGHESFLSTLRLPMQCRCLTTASVAIDKFGSFWPDRLEVRMAKGRASRIELRLKRSAPL